MTTTSRKRLIVVVGPTGSGKTDLAIRLAQHFNTEIVSADSRQIFRGMPIGTAQPTPEQLKAVKHHFVASHDIDDYYASGKYEQEALALLDELFRTHDVVVAVGGSGLYIDALCHGMDRLPEIDSSLRSSLLEEYARDGLQSLLGRLEVLDPEYYKKVDRNNPQRVIRALEVCMQTGQKYSELRSGGKAERNFDVVKVGIEMPRELLYERIDRRVDAMVGDGLEDEARKLYPHRALNSLQTVGYREMFDYFDGEISFDQAVELIKRNSRRYAKRQLTWFKRDNSMLWLAPGDKKMIKKIIEKFAR